MRTSPTPRPDSSPSAAPQYGAPPLLAACWTWAGDAAPGLPGPASVEHILERLRATARAGWDGVGFEENDLAVLRADLGFEALAAALTAQGLVHREVEFLDGWWRQDDPTEIEELLLEAAGALGARILKAGAPLREELDELGPDLVAARLRELGERVAPHGATVALEAMGIPGALRIEEVLDLLALADHRSCGAVVDAFQLARAGTTPGERRELDWSRVVSIELGDGIGTGFDIPERCLPGDGDLGLPEFIRDVRHSGWTGYWGVEIISSELRALPQPEGVRRVRQGVLDAMDRAEALDAPPHPAPSAPRGEQLR